MPQSKDTDWCAVSRRLILHAKTHKQKSKETKKGIIEVKGLMQLEELNMYAPNAGAPRYIKQVLNNPQRDLDSDTIIVGDFNTSLSILDTLMRQKINKDIQDLNSALDQWT